MWRQPPFTVLIASFRGTFRHIVRLDKIRAFNAVNLAQGYGVVTILSPKEVNLDE
jgi:hypothetical protein